MRELRRGSSGQYRSRLTSCMASRAIQRSVSRAALGTKTLNKRSAALSTRESRSKGPNRLLSGWLMRAET